MATPIFLERTDFDYRTVAHRTGDFIGLCRALIYDPEVLFLDEATSSLDVNTESQILDELKIFKEKTIISIAHRINTLKNCDKIYRFDHGRVVDQGEFNKFKTQN